MEMYSFSEEELEQVHQAAGARDQQLAHVVLVAGWTGLRWSELRACR